MSFPATDSNATTALQPSLKLSDRVGYVLIMLATGFAAFFVLQSQPLQSANDRSRWCTVWSLVERGTYQIDEIDKVPQWSTIDKVRHRQNDNQPWHFYSSKPPLLSTMVAGLYWLERNTFGYGLVSDGPLVSRCLLLIINVIPWCLALIAFRGSIKLLGINGLPQWLILVAAGWGSMLSPFLTTLNNHTPAAICLVFCLSAIVRLSVNQQKRLTDFATVGLTAALVVCFELPAALFGVISFLFVVFIDWKKTVRAYVPAAIIPLAAFFITNWICTGGIKPFYAYYGTEKYVYVHEGVPSYWANPQGIDANTESPVVYLFHCVIGHHGVLSITPVFLLTLVGWLLVFLKRIRRKGGGSKDSGIRSVEEETMLLVVAMGSMLSAAILAFYLSRTQNYNYGGNSAALRWMLWLTPFWWYGMIVPVKALSRSKTGVVLTGLLLSMSVYSSVYSIQRPWQPGWIYQRMANAGLIDYRTKTPPFDPPRYSILGSIPESTIGEWESSSGDGNRSVRIESFQQVMIDQQIVIPLQIEVVSNGAKKTASVVVRMEQFRKGLNIRTWLRSSLPNQQVLLGSPDRWVWDLLRGLPVSRAYNAETPRFLKYTRSSGQKWALRCDRGAARVQAMDPDTGPYWQRCDVYYSGEVPFGVAAWFISTTGQGLQETGNVRAESWVARKLPE